MQPRARTYVRHRRKSSTGTYVSTLLYANCRGNSPPLPVPLCSLSLERHRQQQLSNASATLPHLTLCRPAEPTPESPLAYVLTYITAITRCRSEEGCLSAPTPTDANTEQTNPRTQQGASHLISLPRRRQISIPLPLCPDGPDSATPNVHVKDGFGIRPPRAPPLPR